MPVTQEALPELPPQQQTNMVRLQDIHSQAEWNQSSNSAQSNALRTLDCSNHFKRVQTFSGCTIAQVYRTNSMPNVETVRFPQSTCVYVTLDKV